MANTFKFGNGNWAVKDGYALAYNDENNNFKPLPFDFTRASSATTLNRQGLIETVGSGKPRIDFTDNTSGHLLLEPSRKNDITDYTGASFSAFNGASITANDSVSPDGSTNATLMTTTGSANELIQQASITIFSGQSYTVSGYFKLKSGTLNDPDNAFKGLDGLNGGGITGSTFNSTLTSEWQRLSFTVTSSTTSGRVQIKCEDAAEILVWGLQVEQGSYATTLIPTEGSSVTRVLDEADQTGVQQVIGQTEGTLYLEFVPLDASALQILFQIRSSSGSVGQIDLRLQSGAIRTLGSDGGSTQFSFSGGSYTVGTTYKVAVRYKTNDTRLYINGSSAGSDAACSFTSSTKAQISFSENVGTNFHALAEIKEARLYDTALTDTELQNLTS